MTTINESVKANKATIDQIHAALWNAALEGEEEITLAGISFPIADAYKLIFIALGDPDRVSRSIAFNLRHYIKSAALGEQSIDDLFMAAHGRIEKVQLAKAGSRFELNLN